MVGDGVLSLDVGTRALYIGAVLEADGCGSKPVLDILFGITQPTEVDNKQEIKDKKWI